MTIIAHTTTEISLAKLLPCPINVRRTGRTSGIDTLAASIMAHGLLQSLVVRPKPDSEGQDTGRFEVVAGGRRLAALKLLAKQKRIGKAFPVSCRVIDNETTHAVEASLAENIVRQDMHPADQFETFHALHQAGSGVEEIAGRFGISAHTVRQRLRLASVSPALIRAYRKDELTLDHIMAFAVTEDQTGQEEVFAQLAEWQRQPSTIRRLLTRSMIAVNDPKALFVGLDTYTGAGGAVERDLFSDEGEGWITDSALLERLVAGRMEELANIIRAEGWKWVAVGEKAAAECSSFRRCWPETVVLSAEDEARQAHLADRYDALAEL